MSTRTEHDVRYALAEIASWYSASPNPPHDRLEPNRFRGSQRFVLVAALIIVIAGATALIARAPSNELAAGDLGPNLDRTTALDLCLGIDSAFVLDRLRDSGTVHDFGDSNDRELSVIIAAGPLHVACGLSQRDSGEWFKVVSVADIHVPLASADAVSAVIAIDLQDRLYVAGQAGANVTTIEVEQAGEIYTGELVDRWWGASLGPVDDHGETFPHFIIQWTTTAGERVTAAASEVLPITPWRLCVEDSACREGRLVELQALADGGDTGQQSSILADGVVTSAEYRSALRSWGGCIAKETGADVTFDEDGLFTIHERGEHITDAFDQCQQRHIGLVTEAVGLAGIAEG